MSEPLFLCATFQVLCASPALWLSCCLPRILGQPDLWAVHSGWKRSEGGGLHSFPRGMSLCFPSPLTTGSRPSKAWMPLSPPGDTCLQSLLATQPGDTGADATWNPQQVHRAVTFWDSRIRDREERLRLASRLPKGVIRSQLLGAPLARPHALVCIPPPWECLCALGMASALLAIIFGDSWSLSALWISCSILLRGL